MNKETGSKESQKKKKKTSNTVITVPIRLKLEPDGRVIFDVSQVQKAIVKVCNNSKKFEKYTQVVRKDPSAMMLHQKSLNNSSSDEGIPSSEVSNSQHNVEQPEVS